MAIFLWPVLLQYPLFADREGENTLWHVPVKEEMCWVSEMVHLPSLCSYPLVLCPFVNEVKTD
jgi:hypothetical protein